MSTARSSTHPPTHPFARADTVPMSNQVYKNDIAPTPNVYVSQILRPLPGGGASVNSLNIVATPTTNNTSAPFLVRNPNTGNVEQRDSTTVPHAGETARSLQVDQSMANAAETVILFPSVGVSDPGLAYDNGTGVFTVQPGYAGLYIISWSVSWVAQNIGTRWTWVNFSGTPARYGSTNTAATTFDQSLSSSVDRILADGDTFVITGYQNSGGALAVLGFATNGINFTSMTASRTSVAGSVGP
jgi:hypothetical protein